MDYGRFHFLLEYVQHPVVSHGATIAAYSLCDCGKANIVLCSALENEKWLVIFVNFQMEQLWKMFEDQIRWMM